MGKNTLQTISLLHMVATPLIASIFQGAITVLQFPVLFALIASTTIGCLTAIKCENKVFLSLNIITGTGTILFWLFTMYLIQQHLSL